MDTNTVYVQINIGRGDLTDYEWVAFQEDVVFHLKHSAQRRDVQVETHTTEESAHISALVYRPALDGLRAVLRSIKHRYRQDAIALIVGSELI